MPSAKSFKPIDNNGSIAVRFTYPKGQRRTIPLGGRYGDPESMNLAQKVCDRIYRDIVAGEFDFTETRYRNVIERTQADRRKREELDRLKQVRDEESKRLAQEAEKSRRSEKEPSSWEKSIKRLEGINAAIERDRKQKQEKENPHFLPLWDEWVKSLELPARTKEKHYDAIRRMAEKSGNPRLTELEWFTKAELKHTTFNQRRSYLVKFERWVLESRGINPKFNLKSRKAEEFEEDEEPFTREEMKAILDAFRKDSFCPKKSAFKHSHYADYVEFCILTASRPQEAIGLRWKDIDFAHHRLIISTVLARQDKGARKRKELKAGNIKVLPLKGRLLEILETRKPENVEPESLVFPGTKGKPIDDTNFRDRQWIPILNGLKIEYRRFYNIRHSVLTAVVKETGNLMEAAKLAGHKNLRMVQERYGHLVGDTQAFEL
ncbi:phage integrase family protein [Leptolyngbya boryana NIES-2135]|jgi:integrase|uniref:Phage integrase family protein n=1 Tax=Leptolyngbya boryana NIES-2135 TaxID=1973484 RepID=A0A1Z4JHB1_LEPBY|nr:MULTISPECIES: site-specific integrase [Leptolyngbya]BAY56058.1 phage integrase family protein [Leptolyngbya boryana NIES-2135]MBD2366171.1 site-specific integrase [Leptolyngbya sp. FACHB-161]MBD2372351.1 site-specific integrase [Leptolyngbya sp. FACHB-238]MBD2396774.1 site-specific integrase [Leptolyngbya sp. FACHB-239]MBD2403297.1 site-specific integrase [Leptolyngbya sp. FACHB-402]